ncbi:MAG: hypothetical protein WC781_04250 [Candidatus Pacearchaeota archaeon]|jgi:hypothetical protein
MNKRGREVKGIKDTRAPTSYNNILVKSKRSQFQISFGMIFSMILIVVFIVVAFIAVKAFLGVQCNVGTGSFISDFKQEVERIWAGSGEEYIFNGKFSGNCNLKEVCFYNPNKNQVGSYQKEYQEFGGLIIGNNNLYFYPQAGAEIPSAEINHINMESFSENPYCIEVEEGNVQIMLKKGFSEVLVKVSRV